jgi:thiamine-phosphate pyrophosphorylase
MNDSPELAADAHADGVHVGQDDVSVAHCREVLGSDAIVGLPRTRRTSAPGRSNRPRRNWGDRAPDWPTPSSPRLAAPNPSS